MRIVSSLVMGAALLAAGAAWADETWKTDLGVVEWEKDVDGAAVFKLNLKGGKFVRFYIENLKADGQVRGAYSGYWINTADENMCPTQMTAPDGTKSKTWGTIELTFVKPSFPSDWTGRMGKCFDKTEQVFNGISLAK